MGIRETALVLCLGFMAHSLSCVTNLSTHSEIGPAPEDMSRAVADYNANFRKNRNHNAKALKGLAYAVIQRGLRVPSPAIRAQAIQIVERHEIEPFAEDVMAMIADPDDKVAAAASIAVLKAHPQAPKVADDLLSAGDPNVRAYVLRGIAKKIGDLAAPDIVKMLADESPLVRREALAALGAFRSKKFRGAILKMTGDRDSQVRAAALRALASPKPEGRVIEVAIHHLGDSYLGARLAALSLLEMNSSQRAHSALETLTTKIESDERVALAAAAALYRQDSAARTQVIEAGLRSKHWYTRAAAIALLPKLAPKSQVRAWAKLALNDDNPSVVISAARVIQGLGDKAMAESTFRSLFSRTDGANQISAAVELTRLGDADAPRWLSSQLSKSSSSEQSLAFVRAHSSAYLVSEGLVGALDAPATEVQLAAADAVLNLADRGALD